MMIHIIDRIYIYIYDDDIYIYIEYIVMLNYIVIQYKVYT